MTILGLAVFSAICSVASSSSVFSVVAKHIVSRLHLSTGRKRGDENTLWWFAVAYLPFDSGILVFGKENPLSIDTSSANDVMPKHNFMMAS
mmetsp:Transcript_1516/g.2341  ORF Transcript_1516/g.2341 Transcript_1516/m.2341 type:complete len:91 (+) Transcript_1516:55-327(+)